ncbi:DUF4174 domain-containing protein [Acidimangrovimonas pyrenivorans]|uniref:DUF4174 domain-containing protein n=1 Tax=Acidimangrovimonas pyrenivorans TaxID=2030798 RepID=A0ABV7AHE4_9RHOB
MKPVLTLVLAAFLPLAAAAETPAAPAFAPLKGTEVTLAQFKWEKRPLVVFADSPNDPAFKTQMRYLAAHPEMLAERDIVVIADSDPAARSPVREALHPRGFSLVALDKQGTVAFRKPRPWEVREIAAAIDKLPLRREEMLQQRPAGR